MLSGRGWLLLFSLSAFLFVSCGTYKETHKKDYRLYFHTDDIRVKDRAADLVELFNLEAGFQALQVVDDPGAANSPVKFIKGLTQKAGKNIVGYGQWIMSIDQDPELRKFEGRTLKRDIEYTMKLEFDYDYFVKMASLNHPNIAEASREISEAKLKNLFFHEIGHGLKMDHSSDCEDVMYKEINIETLAKSGDKKNYTKFFQDVRTFFWDN